MLRIAPSTIGSLPVNTDLALFYFEREEKPVGSFLFGSTIEKAYQTIKRDGFSGKRGETYVWHSSQNQFPRIIFVGMGPKKEWDNQIIRQSAASALRCAKHIRSNRLAFRCPLLNDHVLSAQAASEGLYLGNYEYNTYKTASRPKLGLQTAYILGRQGTELEKIRKGLKIGRVFSDSTLLARDLINQGPSEATPMAVVKAARKVRSKSVKVRVFSKAQISKLRMNALLGVNRGSARPPFFLHYAYQPGGTPKRKIGLCGKGITFDSGGLSLKPPKAMETMKMDMSGAAAVLAVFKALGKLQPRVEVHGFTPLTENMPGANAAKPGDIFRTRHGKTIEVLNTDAEGRLVLADALSYACEQKLDEIIDLATLTGACVVALGNNIAGIMGNHSPMIERLRKMSDLAGEKLWPLPLEKSYKKHLKSNVADVKNIGPAGEAGTIMGGLFLQEFIDEAIPWCHIDIAGTAWSHERTSLNPVGATGSMIRTLLHYILSYN